MRYWTKLLRILIIVDATSGSNCDLEKYREWFDDLFVHKTGTAMETFYSDIALIKRSDKLLWKLFDLDKNNPFAYTEPLRNGQVMELSTKRCQESIKGNQYMIAGKHHPAKQSDQEVHDAMCSSYCLINDDLRIGAMNTSSCNCLQLSTQPNHISYHKEGDFCSMNSGIILCNDKIEWCGVWDCLLEDFQCMRREYNRKEIPFRGFGWECSSGFFQSSSLSLQLLSIVVAFFYAAI